ncbi:MAG: outer membrane beta-barrel protein [Candidatus Omnitrophica bacterium]|nr:outer membrane beta-barrel protein [Candidatus Omnitrophota bacterium]
MGTKIFKLTLAVVFLACVLPLAETAGAMGRGQSEVNAGCTVQERYDSNLFYDRTDPKHDFITMFIPTLAGKYDFGPEGKHNVWASYLGEFAVFGEHNAQNYGNHDARAGVDLDFNRYSVAVDNRFQFTSSRAGTEFDHRTLRKIDTAGAVLGLDFNKLSYDVGYNYYIVEFLSDTLKQENRYENGVWGAGYIEVQPKTKALVEFDYKNLQYKSASGRNGNQYKIMVGVKGDLTAKLTGIIKGGYGYKKYNDSDNTDFSNAVAHVALMYAFNDRTDITFSYNREAYESIYANNNYYTGDHFMSDINYHFGGQFRDLAAKAELMLFHNYYPEEAVGIDKKRDDFEWAAGLGLDYNIKEWISAGAGYRFQQRASNLGDRRYEQHVVDVKVNVMF